MQEDYPATLPLPKADSDPQQQVSTFDALGEPGAIAETLETFEGDRLLARAMDRPMFRREGLDFGVVDDELGLMTEPGGMRHVSTTLLVPGKGTRVYKPFGLLVDARRAQVEHVADTDSGSNVDNDGNLRANQSDLTTLDELAERIHETNSKEMNEVNVSFSTGALRGLFATNYALPKLDALITQFHIQKQGKGMLPLFVYDQDQGALLPWEPNAEEITELLDTLSHEHMRKFYSALALARLAGSAALTASRLLP